MTPSLLSVAPRPHRVIQPLWPAEPVNRPAFGGPLTSTKMKVVIVLVPPPSPKVLRLRTQADPHYSNSHSAPHTGGAGAAWFSSAGHRVEGLIGPEIVVALPPPYLFDGRNTAAVLARDVRTRLNCLLPRMDRTY